MLDAMFESHVPDNLTMCRLSCPLVFVYTHVFDAAGFTA